MGSPDFAVPMLNALARMFPISGVVTQPDRPAGRGQHLNPPAIKLTAQSLGIPLIQPANLRAPEAMTQLREWNPELLVVAAFGQILRPEVLDLPKFGCVNVHGSLLPRWRGAAPIQAAILAGDHETGITILKMDSGVDTGSLLDQRSIPIHPEDTAGSLIEKLASLGAVLLLETLPGYLSGNLRPQPQDNTKATFAPILHKEDGLLDFSQSAVELVRRIRAFNPWPGAFINWQNSPLKIHFAHVLPGESEPGRMLIHKGWPTVGTTNGLLVLDEVQPPGKKAMPGKAFLAGARNWIS